LTRRHRLQASSYVATDATRRIESAIAQPTNVDDPGRKFQWPKRGGTSQEMDYYQSKERSLETNVTEYKTVRLPNGATARFEVIVPDEGYTQVSSQIFSLDDVLASVAGVAEALAATLEKVKPKTASVEFGVELTLGEGKLLALFVRGEGKANLKVTLEW
jgi:hypothetical protein